MVGCVSMSELSAVAVDSEMEGNDNEGDVMGGLDGVEDAPVASEADWAERLSDDLFFEADENSWLNRLLLVAAGAGAGAGAG